MLVDIRPELTLIAARNATLHISLLGPPEIIRDGHVLPLARRQLRALLYRVAASPHPVPRDQLCFLLWPDVPESAARRNLTVLLNHMRRALPGLHVLVSNDDSISLGRLDAWSDTIAFAEAAAHALRERRIDVLNAAVDMYRGPFLDGFTLATSPEFEEWAANERQGWERRYLEVLAALVEAHSARGDLLPAIVSAQQYLHTDDLAEDMHRRLMTLYAASGDRIAAMRQFERCAIILKRELGVSPLSETQTVYETVRDGNVAIAPVAQMQDDRSPKRIQPSRPLMQLPAPPNPLIGRAHEVATACMLMQQPGMRLLTLCGPGGSGKTRLALQVAWNLCEHMRDGVVFISLAPLQNPNRVIDTIAQACGIQSTSASALNDALRASLRDRHMLLVLDNFEHLLSAATIVADLLAAAPGLRILVTSRIVLNLSGEHTLSVPPLPLPDLEHLSSLNDLATQPAVALLLARVRAHTPAFQLTETNAADIAAICVKLDGLPLAIELAAARMKLLPPQALLQRFDKRLALLDNGPRDLPERQRTLRATIDWSYQLLNPSAQRLCDSLAVFVGSWSLAAVEAICAALGCECNVLNDLQALLDAHLLMLIHDQGNEPRFTMLETIREYALERLRERPEEPTIRQQHAIYFCQFAEQGGPALRTNALTENLAVLDYDYNNVRAALGWAIKNNAYELAARIAVSVFLYWEMRGLIDEGRSWFRHIIEFGTALPQPLYSHVRVCNGFLAYRQGQMDEAFGIMKPIIADTHTDAEDRVNALKIIGIALQETGDLVGARQYLEQSLQLAQKHGFYHDVAGAQFDLGLMYLTQGAIAEAESLVKLGHRGFVRGRYLHGIGAARVALGFIAVLRRDPQQAATLLQDGLQQLTLVGHHSFVLYGLLACCGLATLQQQPLHVATLFGAATGLATKVGVVFAGSLLALVQSQVELARAQTTPARFESAHQDGQSFSLEEAVAFAQSLTASVV